MSQKDFHKGESKLLNGAAAASSFFVLLFVAIGWFFFSEAAEHKTPSQMLQDFSQDLPWLDALEAWFMKVVEPYMFDLYRTAPAWILGVLLCIGVGMLFMLRTKQPSRLFPPEALKRVKR